MLGELPVKSGKVTVNGSISYAAQEPWIFSGTVRNNILFGQIYDQKRYNDIVKCCALAQDFEQLPNGDKTFVGDRGASLSGGQRARISLARAMYKTASIYLLDDPLSAVDAHVSKHLFDEVIGPTARIAKDATRILVTHQVHLLKEADVIVIMENGRIIHRGTYDQLAASDIDFAKLLHEHEKNENKETKLNNETLSDDGKVYEDDGNETKAQINEEKKMNGSFSWKMFSRYFSMGSSRCQIMFLISIFVCTQCVISGTDYFVMYLTNREHELNSVNSQGLSTQHQHLLSYGALVIALILVDILFVCF